MKSVPIWRISSPSLNTVSDGFMAPASRREMSSTAPRMVSTDSSEDSMLAAASAVSPLAGPLDQRGAVEARGIERLQDVVAGRRQEPRLAEIGFLGQHLRLRQLLVDAGQLGGAVPDPLLQRFVDALQREVGLDPGGDVGIGGDQPAVGHRVGAQLDRAARCLQRDLPGRAEIGQPVEHRDDRVMARCRRARRGGAVSGRAIRRPGPSRRAGRTARGTAGSSRSAGNPCRRR